MRARGERAAGNNTCMIFNTLAKPMQKNRPIPSDGPPAAAGTPVHEQGLDLGYVHRKSHTIPAVDLRARA